MTEGHERERGLQLIILGKLIKACFVLAAAVTCLVLLVTGSSVRLHGFLTTLREHVTAAWSIYLANTVVSVTERRHFVVATSALFLDGISTSVEWYALRRGHAWGEWLVVVATSSLIPFEVVALVRHGHVGRILLLLINVLVVVYLVRHVRRRQKEPAASHA